MHINIVQKLARKVRITNNPKRERKEEISLINHKNIGHFKVGTAKSEIKYRFNQKFNRVGK